MRRTDRLFEIIQFLRRAKSPVTAAILADDQEVSPRTIYRDIATLQSMRVPIAGEAGIGYVLQSGYDLPPLNFDTGELEAITVGLSLLGRTGDTKLQQAAECVLSKIDVNQSDHGALRVSGWGIAVPGQISLELVRTVIRDEQKLSLTYRNGQDEQTDRIVLPIALTYYVEVAVLSAWCELRDDFRNFRIDRILACEPLDQFFIGEGNDLRDRLLAEDLNENQV